MTKMSDDLTTKEVLAVVLKAKTLLAAMVAAFVLMSGVGVAIMDWRIAVAVENSLASQDLGTDAKIVAMDKAIDSNTRTGQENEEDIDDLDERVKMAFQALLGAQDDT